MYHKDSILDGFDMLLYCPECDCESLSVDDDNFGICRNPACRFEGYVKKCELEECLNALHANDPADFCYDCLESYAN